MDVAAAIHRHPTTRLGFGLNHALFEVKDAGFGSHILFATINDTF